MAAQDGSSGSPPPVSLPDGIRAIDSLSADEFSRAGPEGVALEALRAAGVPLGAGWIVRLGGGRPRERLVEALRLALSAAGGARLRPLLPSWGHMERFFARGEGLEDVGPEDVLDEVAERFLAALTASSLSSSSPGTMAGLSLLVFACDGQAHGRAQSTEAERGDPERILVQGWGEVAPYLVDRRLMRICEPGEGLDAELVEAAADLADRAQLVLGRPLELEWGRCEDRLVLHCVRPIRPRAGFATQAHRRISLVEADDGTVAPLSLDAFECALRLDQAPAVEPSVSRIYARPYRRWDGIARLPTSTDTNSLLRATLRAARIAADVAAPLSASDRFSRGLEERLGRMDAGDLSGLDDSALLDALREREQLVAEALRLLDRGRQASAAILGALELAVGRLPRGSALSLAAPRTSRKRRRLASRLRAFAEQLVAARGGVERPPSTSPLRVGWDALAAELMDHRPLGVDVAPDAIGRDPARMKATLATLLESEEDARERARAGASRRVLATARSRALGRSREAAAASLLALLKRVARAKGRVSEGLAGALLRVRRVALVAGERLVERGILDEPEDVLYLRTNEVGEALLGEPGAYAARVRYRHEDDRRWAHFDAPRRIYARP